MCNDYQQHVTWAAYCKMMQELALGIPTQQSELDLPQANDIRINDLGPVMRAAGNGIELDEPLQDAEEKSAICAAIESIIEGDAFHEAIAGVDLHIGVAQVLALEPVRLRL
jgi:hypothetical protein